MKQGTRMQLMPRFILRRFSRVISLVGLAGLLSLAACSSFDKPKPTPLEVIAAPKTVGRLAWSVSLDRVGHPVAIGVSDETLALASSRGQIMVIRADNGAEVWRAEIGGVLATGAGHDGRRAAVVTMGNELVLAEAGKVLWRKPLPARAATAPLVAGERVFVLGVDRTLHAFDALDGQAIWTMQRPAGDVLGLVQHGVLAPYKNVLLAGLGPRLTMIDSLRGSVTHEVAVASPRSTNEVERLADLVGPAARVGDVVCARAYQASVGCVDVARGSLLWSKTTSGRQAVGADGAIVVGGDGQDRVTAWKAPSGETLWSHDRVLHRGLSGLAVLPKAVVAGDADGYLHFFDRDTGATLQILPTDGGAVLGAPVLVGKTLVVMKRNGAVHGIVID